MLFLLQRGDKVKFGKIILYTVVFLLSVVAPARAIITFSSPSSTIAVNGGSFVVGTALTGWDGTLQVVTGTVSGSNITFNRGNYLAGDSESTLIATLSPSATSSTMLLAGSNQRIRCEPSMPLPFVTIGGFSNIVEGQPSFTTTTSLQTAASRLRLNIQNNLNKDIALNGGTLELLDNLCLADDVRLTGSGFIEFNKRSLIIPGRERPWSNSLVFKEAADIQLVDRTTLSGLWTFSGFSGVLNGNGNVLDLSLGGTIFISAGITAHFSDVTVVGLSNTGGRIVFENALSTLRLANSTLAYDSSTTYTIGNIYIDGSNCTFITKDNSVTFSQSATLTVDGVSLLYDTTSSPAMGLSIFPTTSNNVNLVYLNRGTIKGLADAGQAANITALVTANSNAIVTQNNLLQATSNAVVTQNNLLIATSNAVVTQNTLLIATSNLAVKHDDFWNTIDHGPANIHFNSASITMSFDTFVSNDHRILIHASTLINGSGHTITLGPNNQNTIVLDPGISATFSNLILDGVTPQTFQLGAGSNLYFGDGTQLHIKKTLDLNTTWSFNGDARIFGAGSTLRLNNQAAIVVFNNKTLSIDDTRLEGLGNGGIHNMRILGANGTIALRQSTLLLEGTYNFTAGKLDFYGDVKMEGPGKLFAYTSPDDSTIRSYACLLVDRGVTFSYDSTAAAPLNNTKGKIVLQDATSQLQLNGCTLHATQTGIRLNTGILVLQDKVVFESEATISNQAMVFGSALTVKVLGGAKLEVQSGILATE